MYRSLQSLRWKSDLYFTCVIHAVIILAGTNPHCPLQKAKICPTTYTHTHTHDRVLCLTALLCLIPLSCLSQQGKISLTHRLRDNDMCFHIPLTKFSIYIHGVVVVILNEQQQKKNIFRSLKVYIQYWLSQVWMYREWSVLWASVISGKK